MSFVLDPVALGGGAIGEDNRRARELYKYVAPDSLIFRNVQPSTVQATPRRTTTPNLSSALRPYVQFAAMRCRAQRAFISVTDETSQYFISEASRVLDVGNAEHWETDESLLWLGCGGVSKDGKLCEMTLALPRPQEGEYPFYIVNDLTQHPKYGKLPFVTGEPHFRYYAGTPLTTPGGIRIGSLCIMDTKVRDDLPGEMRDFLGHMAEQIMDYLIINKDALNGRRSELLSDTLNGFVQGKTSIFPTSRPSAAVDQAAAGDKLSEWSGFQESNSTGIGSQTTKVDESASITGTTTSGDGTENQHKPTLPEDLDESQSHSYTFTRAANLLREGLEIDTAGGVLFLEAINRSAANAPQPVNSFVPPETDTSGTDEGAHSGRSRQTSNVGGIEARKSQFAKSSAANPMVPCPVQASSTAAAPMAPAEHPINHKFKGFDSELLRDLLQRYPRGKLWVFDASGTLMSSDDDQTSTRKSVTIDRETKKGRRKREAEQLQRLFPGSRQLIFAPVWDAGLSKWVSGCFCWSSSDHRTYTAARELSFVLGFSKTIMAELSRLNTIISDKQKGDFIGSVSHELRSPLHGVLAAAEFLGETDMSQFQKSLVETIESCGRTLLDTINHVLDYSKINTFERTWQKTKYRKNSTMDASLQQQPVMRQLPNEAPPLLRLYAHTDIAAIAEEVVEGLCVGRLYAKTSDLTDLSAAKLRRQSLSTDENESVDVLLDIQAGDWRFVTQPGALRRVIMNLVGNSLKYTSSGSIKVSLRQQASSGNDTEAKQDERNITLTVSDTGQGISQEYLQSKLFVPFAQEDSLAPGTGLGLSIVRSIVTMLSGTIDCTSVVGKGTTFTVSLPVARPSAGSLSDSSNPPSDSTVSSLDDFVHPLQGLGKGKAVSVYTPPPAVTMSPRLQDWNSLISSYLREWFELDLTLWDQSRPSEIIVVEEQYLVHLASILSAQKGKHQLGLIILCNNATHGHVQVSAVGPDSDHIVEQVSKPFGPYKLARAFKSCLERIERHSPTTGLNVSSESFESPPSEQIMATTDLSGQMQEMELNSTDNAGRPVVVQTNETVTVAESSRNAQMALNSPFIEGPSGSPSPSSEFPFPDTPPTSSGAGLSRPEPGSRQNSAMRSIGEELQKSTGTLTEEKRGRGATRASDAAAKLSESEIFDPRVLLVDDNAINLRLLQTFFKKRKCAAVDSAENGAVAVNTVTSSPYPYDIIFMDISMPVMNGFEATRAIREWEASKKVKKPAMVIALTGLASGRDQSEGFASGVDIYMTKPVSFKEVSRFLDNWQINKSSKA